MSAVWAGRVAVQVGRAVVRASWVSGVWAGQVGRALVTVRVDLVVLWAGRAVVHVVRVAVQADQVVRSLGMDGARRDRDGRRVSRAELEGGAEAVDRE
ncbi:hypothetical protein ACWEO2_24050 [Nocardia sp. NPDC004278]